MRYPGVVLVATLGREVAAVPGCRDDPRLAPLCEQPARIRTSYTAGYNFNDFFDDVVKPLVKGAVNYFTGGQGGKYVEKSLDWATQKDKRQQLRDDGAALSKFVNEASIEDLYGFFYADLQETWTTGLRDAAARARMKDFGVPLKGYNVDIALRTALSRSLWDQKLRTYATGAIVGLGNVEYGPRALRLCGAGGKLNPWKFVDATTPRARREAGRRINQVIGCLKKESKPFQAAKKLAEELARQQQRQAAAAEKELAAQWRERATGAAQLQPQPQLDPWYKRPLPLAAAAAGAALAVGITAALIRRAA